MLPSITIKFFVPLVLTPVTLLTKQQVLAISDLPGSMIRVRSRESTNSLTYNDTLKLVIDKPNAQSQGLADSKGTTIEHRRMHFN